MSANHSHSPTGTVPAAAKRQEGPDGDRAFALSQGEPLPSGLRRVGRSQIASALERLEPDETGFSEEAVHEARKSLKRLRALARLLQGELGAARYRRENGALRDDARHLAAARDAEVMLATLDAIMRRHPDRDLGDGAVALRAQLSAERDVAAQRLLADPGPVESVAGDLRRQRRRIQRWIGPEAEFAAIEPGLKRIYGQGRQRLRAVQAKPTSANLHDWRKRVKDLRYSAEILAPAGPKRMRRTARRADRLGELLGEEHDLALLGGLVERRAELFSDDAGRRDLLKLIDRRRSRLRREALRRGAKLYARKPGAFVGRTARAWSRQANR